MTFILAILGFVLAALKTRVLAILYCVFGLLTIILATIVGSIQITTYTVAMLSPFNICYILTLNHESSFDIEAFILPLISGLVLLITSFLLIFSWAGSLFYIGKPDDNSV